jgi:hypothetical protein
MSNYNQNQYQKDSWSTKTSLIGLAIIITIALLADNLF